MKSEWYAVWVLTGKEADALRRIQSVEKVLETMLPKAVLWQRKAGEWAQTEQLLFPGYVFIRCKMDSDVYHTIRNVPEVIGWLGKDTLWPAIVPTEDMARVTALTGASPGAVLTDIRLDKRQRRGYGTIQLQGRDFRVPFNIYQQSDDKQAEAAPGDASPEAEKPEQIRRNGAK